MLDANVLITANRLYYPIERVPEFWDWLLHMGQTNAVKIPLEVLEEVCEGSDETSEWLSDRNHRDTLLFDEEVEIGLVQRVIEQGYAQNLTDEEVEIIGRDPFLIAAALRDARRRCVITTEVSKPKRQRANRHIPDVCRSLGVDCGDSFALIRTLNFTTSWRHS